MRIISFLMPAFLLTASFAFCASTDDAEAVFSRIYDQGEWGRNSSGTGISGVGSIYQNAKPYVKLLQKFIKQHHIRSVVDVGCGDWELSKHIRWGSIKYCGYDVVKSVIDQDSKKYGSKTRTFICADGAHARLPKADLVICKDVLQHLPNSYIHAFLSQISKFKYCLITNDISAPSVKISNLNKDIPLGSGRFIDLTKAPFYIKGKKILTYTSPGTVKQVLLICPQGRSH